MRAFLSDVRATFIPDADERDGPLAPLLVALTFTTGIVDAFSYLLLGHVFVANMTGNVLLLGFSLVGASGFSTGASLVAIASFAVSAYLGGRLDLGRPVHRARLLAIGTSLQAVAFTAALVLVATKGTVATGAVHYGIVIALALAMGLQNAIVQRLGVAELTTTVLTRTITGIAVDGFGFGVHGGKVGRRVVAVLAMLAGAVVGAVLVLHAAHAWALAVALTVIATVGTIAWTMRNVTLGWTALATSTPPGPTQAGERS